MAFGEAVGRFGRLNPQTSLTYSCQAFNAAIAFIRNSGSPGSFMLEHVNEALDNPEFATIGSPASLSDSGAAWVL